MEAERRHLGPVGRIVHTVLVAESRSSANGDVGAVEVAAVGEKKRLIISSDVRQTSGTYLKNNNLDTSQIPTGSWDLAATDELLRLSKPRVAFSFLTLRSRCSLEYVNTGVEVEQ